MNAYMSEQLVGIFEDQRDLKGICSSDAGTDGSAFSACDTMPPQPVSIASSIAKAKSIAVNFFFMCKFRLFYLQILWTHCAKVPVPSPSTSPCPAFQISA